MSFLRRKRQEDYSKKYIHGRGARWKRRNECVVVTTKPERERDREGAAYTIIPHGVKAWKGRRGLSMALFR